MSYLALLLEKNEKIRTIPEPCKPGKDFTGFTRFTPSAKKTDFFAPSDDADSYCWPNGPAANTRELALMAHRLATFARIGLAIVESERMADKLMQRDREGDDRHACVECGHLSGRWRCGSFRQRGATAPGLPRDYTMMLTRCNAWRAAA